MRGHLIALSFIISISAALSGCGGGTTPANSTANSNTTNVTTNSNNPLETNKKTPDPVTNNAPTLTPVFKAYCEAKIKNDEAGLRKIYSQATIKHFEEEMKKEKIKTLTEFLAIDKVTGKLCEITNERVTGDKAIARIKYDSYPNGIDVVFIKENGEWKMTDESPTFQSVKQSNTAANNAK